MYFVDDIVAKVSSLEEELVSLQSCKDEVDRLRPLEVKMTRLSPMEVEFPTLRIVLVELQDILSRWDARITILEKDNKILHERLEMPSPNDSWEFMSKKLDIEKNYFST